MCLLVNEFSSDAMLCFTLGNENPDTSHIKSSREQLLPRPCAEQWSGMKRCQFNITRMRASHGISSRYNDFVSLAQARNEL